ncbi:MAG TPA: MBL fold metallo-hydrolase [Armatimonadota bacterium]|nr:MBL fold metallo-hydrolase [Armatimonadota bacterium]
MATVVMLTVEFELPGHRTAVIHPVIAADEQEMVLVDCGYPNSLSLLRQAVEAKGMDLRRLTKVIITHHDHDHMGGLAQLRRAYPHIEVIASAIDAPFVSGKEKSLRLQQAERLFPDLPESEKPAALLFQQMLESVEPVPVDIRVNDGDVFPWCGGTEIIATPGHMPGHISVYFQDNTTLVAGDALAAENGQLHVANPQYTLNLPEAKRSTRKLLAYDIDTIICYHGGMVTKDIRESLQRISES